MMDDRTGWWSMAVVGWKGAGGLIVEEAFTIKSKRRVAGKAHCAEMPLENVAWRADRFQENTDRCFHRT